MKKTKCIKSFFSVALAICFIITILPIGAFATQKNNLTQEELSMLVCGVFPEYTSKINGNGIRTSNVKSCDAESIVHKEVRKISDNNYALYLEYGDGFVIYGVEQYDPDIIFDQAYSSGDILYFSCRITLSNNYNSQIFVVNDVRFQIDHNGYDSITSRGDLTDSTAESSQFGLFQLRETASSPAYTSYIATFTRPGKLSAELTIYLYVELDSYRIEY